MKIEDLISDEKSHWKEDAEFRRDNKKWLLKSAKIALKILRHIKDNDITQVELAEKLGVTPQQVNKIVRGSENLTLETISKIEEALGIALVEIPNFTQTVQIANFSNEHQSNLVINTVYDEAKTITHNDSYQNNFTFIEKISA